MLRAVEAANVEARDVVVELEKRQVKLNIRKSKADQKGVGAWRTLECCGENECERDCPFNLATLALNDLQSNDPHSPLFPDSHGNLVSKVHMVTAWANLIDCDMSGHSARRSGAMQYARKGISVHRIQFLGRWKSSAVFRYIEEAMTEIPMNSEAKTETSRQPDDGKRERERKRALRPQSSAAPKRDSPPGEQVLEAKPLLDQKQADQVFAMSKARGKLTKHIVGQAAWGIPLDSWATICGWNFAKRNVKVELTQHPQKSALECKKCFKLEKARDRVKGAQEWQR